MKRKSAFLLCLGALSLLVACLPGPIKASPGTTLHVDPVWSGDPNDPFASFVINVNVTDAVDLYGFDFYLRYDPNILTATFTEFGTMFRPDSWILVDMIDDVEGWVHYAATNGAVGWPDGVFGDGILFKIHFDVDDYGRTYLPLTDIQLKDSGNYDIPYELRYGYFANIATTLGPADLVGKSAWPEHHHFNSAKDANQSLYAKVRYLGTAACYVGAQFDIYDNEYGLIVATINATPILMTTSGETKVVEALWTGYVVGTKYSVEAHAKYDTDGDGFPDTLGPKLKTFSFAVV